MQEKLDIGCELEKLYEERIFVCYAGRIYENQGTWWRIIKFDEVPKRIRCQLPEKINRVASSSQIKELERRILTDYRFEAEEQDVKHPEKLNLENGVLNLNTGVLESEVKDMFLYRLNFRYRKEASLEGAPYFNNFLSTSLVDTEKIQLLLETLGYVISEYTDAHTAICYIGESGTGKSLTLNLVKQVVGEENITNIQFNELGGRFNKARLAGAKINICSEMQGGRFKGEDIFKAIVSNERITAENKGEHPFEFTVKTKLLSAGNVFPEFSSGMAMDAILRRLTVLRFTKKIVEPDRNLAEKLWEERDIIFSLAADRLMELKNRNFQFVKTRDSETFFQGLRQSATVIEDFIENRCCKSSDARVHTYKLWEEFETYLAQNALDVKLTKMDFTQRIAAMEGVERERFRMDGKNLWGFRGIGMIEETEKKSKGKAPIIKAFIPSSGRTITPGKQCSRKFHQKNAHNKTENGGR